MAGRKADTVVHRRRPRGGGPDFSAIAHHSQMHKHQVVCHAYSYPPTMLACFVPVMMPPCGRFGPWHSPGGSKGRAHAGTYEGYPASGSIKGRVWLMARNSHDCRVLQDAFDRAGRDDIRLALAEELHGHVWEAIMCKNANHVIQKCIESMRPGAVQFIIDEIVQVWSAHAAETCVFHTHADGQCYVLVRMPQR